MRADDIHVRLSVPTDVANGGEVPLSFSLSNTSSDDVRILIWHTPLEGVLNKIFRIWRDGQELPYEGIIAKRRAPRPSDYVTIPAGNAIDATVDLADSFYFDRQADYEVEFVSPIASQVARTRDELAKTQNELSPLSLTSPRVEFSVARGAAPDQAPSAKRKHLRDAGDRTSQVEAKTIGYTDCSSSERTDVEEADSGAATNAQLAHGYLSGLDASARPTNELYNRWFGAYTAARFATVVDNLDTVATTLKEDDIDYDCSGPACTNSTYAYVYSGGDLEVFLCPAFWAAGLSGYDTRWGTIVHEVSHEVASTDDNAYGQTNCQALAMSDPDSAIENADSYEYFVEDYIKALGEGCNAILQGIGNQSKKAVAAARKLAGRG